MRLLRTTILLLVLAFGAGCSTVQDYNKGLTAYKAGDYTTALAEWRPLAEQGDPGAQYNLGLMYYKGQGVIQDNAEAMKWYRLAVEQGYESAQYNLGKLIANGIIKSH